jgi:hypothetical protein
VVVALWGAHCLALGAESRGWIYYRTHRMPVGSAGMAMLEVTSLLDPAAEHVIEEVLGCQARTEEDEGGSGR